MSEFHFLRPYWFLALIPIGVLLWQLWHRKYHSRSWRAVCDPRLLPFLLTDSGSKQTRWPVMIVAFVSLLVVLALAGPVWEKLDQPVFREQSALVIVLDLSRSMDAADIKPSRVARARHKIIDLLRKRKEGQTALLVYAAEAYPVSPLTEDSNTVIAMVKTLTTQLMPAQGSAPDKALQRATTLLKQAGVVHGHILLITDGVAGKQVEKLAQHVTQSGHQLSVLGIGTAQGAPISMEGGGFLKDQSGAIVIPKLDSATLAKLARLGGGRYHDLTAAEADLDYLLAGMQIQRLNAERKETSFIADRWREQGPWLLLVVLPFAALAFRKGYLALLIVITLPLTPQPVHAFEWDELWQRPEQRAAEVLQQEKSPASLPSPEVFNDPEWKAAAHYRAGQYQQAVDALSAVDNADALYNKGNALAKMGKLPEAIKAYDEALKKDPAHEDAKYNRQLVEQQLKQQQQSDQSNQDQDQSSDQKQKQDDKQNQQQNQSGDQNREQNTSQNQPDDKNKPGDQDQQQMKPEQQEAKESDQDNQTQQKKAEEEQQQESGEKKEQLADSKEQREQKEMKQATEQWLRRIPDDPGGLLRRKFRYEHQRQQRQYGTGNSNNGQPAW